MRHRSALAPALVLVLVAAAAPAHAQPGPSQPAIDPVLEADLEARDLRVAIDCSYMVTGPTWLGTLASPDGLVVSVDGRPLPTTGLDVDDGTFVNEWGHSVMDVTASYVGFQMPEHAGRVHLEVPGCKATDVDLAGVWAPTVTGVLAIDKLALRDAPDGGGLFAGAVVRFMPGLSLHESAGTTTTTSATLAGFAIGARFTRPYWTMSLMGTGAFGSLPVINLPRPTGMAVDYGGGTFRIGGRLPLGRLALEAGAGVGFAMLSDGGNTHGQLVVPAWASATVKPWCNWGVQAMGSYDVDPLAPAASTFGLTAGIVWEPSTACRARPGFRVR